MQPTGLSGLPLKPSFLLMARKRYAWKNKIRPINNKGIIQAIIVQEPCGLINTVYVLFSSWFWKTGYFPEEKGN